MLTFSDQLLQRLGLKLTLLMQRLRRFQRLLVLLINRQRSRFPLIGLIVQLLLFFEQCLTTLRQPFRSAVMFSPPHTLFCHAPFTPHQAPAAHCAPLP